MKHDTAPFLFHLDASVPNNSPDFVHDDLDFSQQAAMPSPYGDVTFDPVVSEAGEGEGAVGVQIEG